jgi:hypothetical protein
MHFWNIAAVRRLSILSFMMSMVLALGLASGDALAKSKPLTEESVKQFIASYPAVRKIAIEQGAQKGKDIASSQDTLMAVIQAVSDSSAESEVDAVVQAHGFKDAKEWGAVASSIGRAYAHLKLGPSDSKAQKKVDKAIAKIEKNDFLSEKQKEKLVKALRGGADVALKAPPEENVAAVRPMVAELEAVVK